MESYFKSERDEEMKPLTDQEVIDLLQDAQMHWKRNGLFNNFTVEEAIRFNCSIEEKVLVFELKKQRQTA
jgi:hypothetical protein